MKMNVVNLILGLTHLYLKKDKLKRKQQIQTIEIRKIQRNNIRDFKSQEPQLQIINKQSKILHF
ncbi:unnamed protein product [Paramecium primaurelia]|uniref:Uncharacterized protein n=1 Tax=Paramecium primaurelia TaxID=5886 RepID=A0A8S1LL34_PARPR|nr:unnamed protein product [Paramecium primaurelia]